MLGDSREWCTGYSNCSLILFGEASFLMHTPFQYIRVFYTLFFYLVQPVTFSCNPSSSAELYTWLAGACDFAMKGPLRRDDYD